MLKISAYQPSILPNKTEEKIFSVIRNTCNAIPSLSEGKYSSPIARCVGGWVRDKLLGLQSDDLDISIDNMTGEQFAQFLVTYAQRQGLGQEVKHSTTTKSKPEQSKHLETAIVKMFGQKVDIVNLRSETYTEGNRIPQMRLASAQSDAARRDLTINSLFYRINDDKLEDYTGSGQDDLNAMILRMPGDPRERLMEDPLRLMRILRFYSRYPNSRIDDKTYKAMKDEQVQQLLTQRLYDPSQTTGITAERVADEFKKLMKSDNPAKGLKAMFQIGLGQKIFQLPDNFDPDKWNMNQRNKHHVLSILDHTLTSVEAMDQVAKQKDYSDTTRMLLNMAALFHDIGKVNPEYQQEKENQERSYHGHELGSADMSKAFSHALKLSNNEREIISALVRNHMRGHQYVGEEGPAASVSALRRFKRKNTLKIDMATIKEQLADPNLDPENKKELEDELQSMIERQNMWDLVLSLSAADASAKEKEIQKSKQSPYFELQKQVQELHVPEIAAKASDLLNGYEIMNIFAPYGADPSSGYIERVKETIRELQDENPELSKNDAAAYLKANIKKFV